jgi:hypothetical protein
MELLVAVEAAGVKEEKVTVPAPLQSTSGSLPIIVFALESMLRAFFLAHSFKFVIPEPSTILETLSLVLAVLTACLVIVELPHEVRPIGEDKCSLSIRLALSESAHE